MWFYAYGLFVSQQVKKSGKDPKVGAEVTLGEVSRKTTVRLHLPLAWNCCKRLCPDFKRDMRSVTNNNWLLYVCRCVIVPHHLSGMRHSASWFETPEKIFLLLRYARCRAKLEQDRMTVGQRDANRVCSLAYQCYLCKHPALFFSSSPTAGRCPLVPWWFQSESCFLSQSWSWTSGFIWMELHLRVEFFSEWNSRCSFCLNYFLNVHLFFLISISVLLSL